jgi:hypothetical protein
MNVVEDLMRTMGRQGKFGAACFELLGQFYSDPIRLFTVFRDFVGQILSDRTHEKVVSLQAVQSAVAFSPLFLDAFLHALDEFNGKDGQSVTILHTFLQKELPAQNWSSLTHSRLLFPSHAITFPKGPLDLCVLEILFANSNLTYLSRSEYCDIEAKDLYSLLSETARDRFADANILRHSGNPIALLTRLETSSDCFLASVFRRRDELGPLLNIFTPPAAQSDEFLMKIEAITPRIPVVCLFPFFNSVIFPNVSILAPEFLHQLFLHPSFPSDDPAFPSVEFVASTRCIEQISLRVFLDVFTRVMDQDLMQGIFDRIVRTEEDPMDILSSLFRTPISGIERFKSLFVIFVSFSNALSADLVYHSASLHLTERTEAVSSFYSAAVTERVRLDLFLTAELLQLFWDHSFINPGPSLKFLLAVVESAGDVDIVIDFWDSPTMIPCMIDSVCEVHESALNFLEFILELAKRGPEWIVRKFQRYADDLPCVNRFMQCCLERFGSDGVTVDYENVRQWL